MDGLQITVGLVATVASPAITELVKKYEVPDGISPLLNFIASLLLHLAAYGLFELLGQGGGKLYSYLVQACVVAVMSGGAESAKTAIRGRGN